MVARIKSFKIKDDINPRESFCTRTNLDKTSSTNLRKCTDFSQEYPAGFVVNKVDKVCQYKDESLSINIKAHKKP